MRISNQPVRVNIFTKKGAFITTMYNSFKNTDHLISTAKDKIKEHRYLQGIFTIVYSMDERVKSKNIRL